MSHAQYKTNLKVFVAGTVRNLMYHACWMVGAIAVRVREDVFC